MLHGKDNAELSGWNKQISKLCFLNLTLESEKAVGRLDCLDY